MSEYDPIIGIPIGGYREDKDATIKALQSEVEALKHDIARHMKIANDAEAKVTKLREAITQFIADANKAPERMIGNGVGGQTMSETMRRHGRLISEWRLGQLEEALGGDGS